MAQKLIGMSTIKRKYLRKDELREMTKALPPELQEFKNKMKDVEIVDTDEFKIILSNKEPLLLLHQGKFLPLLTSPAASKIPKVVVDMGAVPHIANGADIMGPGVVSADESIHEGGTVVVVDEKHGKTLAVGIALVPGGEMRGRKGKVVENIHHVSDKIWKLLQSLKS
ncbi:MAG: PUA domain-containing protein [Candidatus Hadarchaeales archaeon]